MHAPPTPDDEDLRIRTLRSLCILDTGGEERFDRITRVAQRLFGVPIALVSLVDSDRQWFKSKQGLDADETSREISFCGHAILSEDIMVVADTARDERFADNPLVSGDPKIRFYAGCPVQAPNGQQMGTLCLIDREPREFAESDRLALRDMAGMVEAEIASLAMATTDVLTRISNRRGFEMLGDNALHAAALTQQAVALVFIDLDRFKEVNDSFGHAAGDQALVEISSLLDQAFRGSDVVARLGGDEFGILMTGIEADALELPLARLAARIAERNAAPDSIFQIEYSAGVVTDEMRVPRSMSSLLEEADRVMYEAKQKRRVQRGST